MWDGLEGLVLNRQHKTPGGFGQSAADVNGFQWSKGETDSST